MFIVQALVHARTQYIVYFMLSAWLESAEHNGAARALPLDAKALPLRGATDIERRFALVRQELCSRSHTHATDVHALEDAVAAFAVACEKLRELSSPGRAARTSHDYPQNQDRRCVPGRRQFDALMAARDLCGAQRGGASVI